MEKKYTDYACMITIVICILWFCQDLVVNGEVPFYRDLTNYFYPLRYSLYESYRAGELPLWDRHFAQGFPNLAAFQTGAFYPPHFVLFSLPFYLSIRMLFVFHFIIAGIGTYKLLRRWDYSWDLSLIGALSFTLGGVIVSLTNLLNHFQSAVWLPLVILAWERVLLAPRWSSFVTFTLMAGLQFLAGSPEMFAMTMVLAFLDGIRMRDTEPEVSWPRILGLGMAGNLLMVAVVMAQFLPTAELILESRRGQSILESEAFMWSLNPQSLLNLFILDKEIDPSVGIGVTLFFTRDVPFLMSNYLGIICLFGIALWYYYGTKREILLLSALALGSLALALGGNALIYPFLFHHVPFVSAIRFPEKFFFLTYALVLVMALRGLKAFLVDGNKKLGVPAFILGLISLAWICLYLSAWIHSDVVANFISAHSNIPALSENHAKAIISVLTMLQRQAILSFAFVSLLILFKAEMIRPLLFSSLFVAAVYVDLAWAHKNLLFTVHPDRFHETAPVIQSSQTQLTRFFFYPSANDLHPAFITVNGQPNFEQAVALSFQNYLPNVGVFAGIEYFQEIDALGRRPYNDFLRFANSLEFDRQLKLLRTFNVGYLVSFRDLPQRGVRLVEQFPKYFSRLYRIEGTVPRAYVVDRVFVENDPLKALERLSQLRFDPLREVVLDSSVKIQASESFEARAHINRYENNSVTVQATANRDSVLVLADSFYPGWKAFVDGNETKILRANHFFRAVVLPKGAHRVEFRYEPWSFKIGWILSVFTTTAILLVSLGVFYRRRKLVATNPVRSAPILQN